MNKLSTDNFVKHTTNSKAQRFFINKFLNKLIAIIKPLAVKRILDVGCGEGFTLKKIENSGIKSTLEGIEYLEAAIKLGKKINPSIRIRKGTIYKLPYKDNTFDLVICTEVLEHLENPDLALSELKRVSKKYLLLSVPNEPFFMLANFLRGKNLSRWGNDIEHINHWTVLNFKSFVSRHKLKIIQAKYPFPWILLLTRKT